MHFVRLFLVFSTLLPGGVSLAQKDQKPITIYSSRKTHLLEPLVQLYNKTSEIPVTIVNGDAGVLIERLKREGANSPADIFMTVDAGNLWYAATQNLLRATTSKVLEEAVPKAYRDPQGKWFGLSLRARTLFYNRKNVKASDLESYEGLADKKFANRLCLRTSRKVYNQSLVASLVDRLGPKKTEAVVKGWVQNLEKPVFTSDTLLLKAIDRGQCDVGIANTYYMARLQKKGEGKNVGVFWPNQKKGSAEGVHVNVSGAGVTVSSKQPLVAQGFLEFLASDKAQNLFASLNDEYPVKKGISISPTLSSWGAFQKDTRPMTVYGSLQKKAIQIMDKVRYR